MQGMVLDMYDNDLDRTFLKVDAVPQFFAQCIEKALDSGCVE